MKKTTTVKIPAKKAIAAKPAKTKTVTKTVCDFCDANIPNHGSYGWYPSCHGCGRDTCRKHNQAYRETWSDYPEWFCDVCIKLCETKYNALLEQITTEFENKEEALEKQLRKESLGQSTKKTK